LAVEAIAPATACCGVVLICMDGGRCKSTIDCTLQLNRGPSQQQQQQQQQQNAGNQLASGQARAPPAPLPPLPRLPKPMSAVRYIGMMIRNDPDLSKADIELGASGDELSDEEAGEKKKEDKKKDASGVPTLQAADSSTAEVKREEQEKKDSVDGANMDVDDGGVKKDDTAEAKKETGVEKTVADELHAAKHTDEENAGPRDSQGAETGMKEEQTDKGASQVKSEDTDTAGKDGVASTGEATKGSGAMEMDDSKSAMGASASEAANAAGDAEMQDQKEDGIEDAAKMIISEEAGGGKSAKDCGLDHELVGEILMCWSMLRRLASHLTLPDLSLDTFVAAMCSTQSSGVKRGVGGSGNSNGLNDSEEDSGDEQVGSAMNGGVDTSIRATYQDDVYISLLYELCSELRRRETLVPSSGALNVYTWPEALRTYLIWMAHHIYLVSVGCERDTQNERPYNVEGTEEGKRRLNAMEQEMYTMSDKLLNVADFLKHFEFSSLALSDRILVLSSLLNQLLHTGKFHQQVDQEENRANQVRYSLSEMMNGIKDEDEFSSNPVRNAPLPPPATLPDDADEETRAKAQADRDKLEAQQKSRAMDDAAKRVAHVKRIVRPSKALLNADGTKLPFGVELKGTKVLINGLPEGHELPAGVRRCTGTIFRTLMPGWHEVRRVDWPGAHAGGFGAAKPVAGGGAGAPDAASGEPPVDEGALLDYNFVCDEELRKLHQVKVKTAKLELIAEADRRCTVLTCREEPLGYDRHNHAVMRWNGYLNEVFVQDERHRWGVYRGEALERYMKALEASQDRFKQSGLRPEQWIQSPEGVTSSNESKILRALREVKGYIGELKAAGGQVDAVADMMRPRETPVLSEDARKVRNGELNATPFLREEPGEITCAFTGETYSPKTHVHCPITLVTIDKQRYNSQKAGKPKKGAKGANSMPALKTWKAHLADLRMWLSADTSKGAQLRAELEKRCQPEQAAAAAQRKANGAGGEADGEGGGVEMIKGYNDVVNATDFEEVLKELELAPSPEHLITWRSLAGPSVKEGLIYFLRMFDLLEAVQRQEPLALPQELAPIKRALMDMEAAIPGLAMPLWSDERREQWVYMVKYAADVEELLVALLYLEACIERSWMKLRSRPIQKRLKLKHMPVRSPSPEDEDLMLAEATEALAEDDEGAKADGKAGGEQEDAGVGSKRKAGDADAGAAQGERRETKILEPQVHELTHANPYQNFVRVMAAELRITEPELKGPGKMKRLGQLWQGLSEEEHKKWVQQEQPAQTPATEPCPGDEGKEDAGDEATGGTRSWKRKDKEVGEAGPAGTIGRVRRSVPAVSTVNLDKHSHVTLLQAQILKKFSL